MRVLVTPGDFRKDKHVLKPPFERPVGAFGRQSVACIRAEGCIRQIRAEGRWRLRVWRGV